MNQLETVQRIYQAFAERDAATILDHVSDDVQWESWADNSAQKAGVPWLEPRTGKAGVRAFLTTLGQLVVLKDFQVLSMMEGGRQVAVEFVIEYDVPSSGAHLRDEEMHLWTFNDAGQVIRLRHYTDTAKHIAAKPRQIA